jgi:hypothetical protein
MFFASNRLSTASNHDSSKGKFDDAGSSQQSTDAKAPSQDPNDGSQSKPDDGGEASPTGGGAAPGN